MNKTVRNPETPAEGETRGTPSILTETPGQESVEATPQLPPPGPCLSGKAANEYLLRKNATLYKRLAQ